MLTQTRQSPNLVEQGRFVITIRKTSINYSKVIVVKTIKDLKYELEWGFLDNIIRLTNPLAQQNHGIIIESLELNSLFSDLKLCFDSKGTCIFEHLPDLIGENNLLDRISKEVRSILVPKYFSDIQISICHFAKNSNSLNDQFTSSLEEKINKLETIVFALSEKIGNNNEK